jgi:transposase-like protein
VWFKHRAWIPVSWLLSAANVASVFFAAQPGEAAHATVHAALAVLFGLGAQHLARRRQLAAGADLEAPLREIEDRLAELDRLPAPDGRMNELEERLDFLERALVEVRTRTQRTPKPPAGRPHGDPG